MWLLADVGWFGEPELPGVHSQHHRKFFGGLTLIISCCVLVAQDTEYSMDDFYEGQLLTGELGALQHVQWLNTTRAYSPAMVKRNARQQIVVCVEKVSADFLL